MLDQTTEFGQRAARRLREAIIGWLTTVSSEGAPQPIPVWFLWDGGPSILLYSRPEKRKLRNIAANPIVVCWGEVRISGDPPADEIPEYVDKYAERIAALGWTPESFAADFSVPLRIELTRIHGW